MEKNVITREQLDGLHFIELLDEYDNDDAISTLIVSATDCFDIVDKACNDWDSYECEVETCEHAKKRGYECDSAFEHFDKENICEFIFSKLDAAGILYKSPTVSSIRI